MAAQDELAHLEAERDRLRSMIAYHNATRRRLSPFPFVGIGVVLAVVVLVATRLFFGEIAIFEAILVVVFLGLSAYILTRKITLFGITTSVSDLHIALEPGAPEAHRHLAECEARILKLKDSRS
jgi:hypothetical protein